MPESWYLTQRDLARLFGKTTRTVHRWDDVGLEAVRTGPNATYDVGASIAWLIERERADAFEAGKREALNESPDKVEERKQLALAVKYETDVKVKLGKLVDMEEAPELFERTLSRIRAVMLALPGRIVPRLTRYKVAEALALIEPIVHEAMETMSLAGTDVDDASDLPPAA